MHDWPPDSTAHPRLYTATVGAFQFHFQLKMASWCSERPTRAPPRLSAVSPRLPSKQCQYLSGWTQIVLDHGGWSVDRFLSPLLFPLSGECEVRTVIIITISNNNRIQRSNWRFFYNLITAPRSVSNTYAQVVRAQSFANHVQHIERLSRATCRATCHVVRRDSSAIKFDRVVCWFVGWLVA